MTDESKDEDEDRIPSNEVTGAAPSQEHAPPSAADSEPTPRRRNSETMRQQLRRLEAEGRALRAIVDGIANPSGTADVASTSGADVPPRPEDFKDRDDYLIARAKHELRTEDGQATARAQVEEAQVRANESRARFLRRAEAVRAKHEDFDEVLSNPALAASRAMVAVIREADDGPELAYWLGKHLDEAERIAGLSPAHAALELGKISAQLAAPFSRAETSAPEPVTTVSGLTSPTRDPNRMSMTDYRAWRESGSGKS